MKPKLTTKRLIMRPLTGAHFETFYQTFILDAKTMRFWHDYHAELLDKERREMVQRDFFDHFEESKQLGYPTWAISQKTDPRKLIGWCGLWLPKFEAFGPELAYMLASPHHGQGLIPEAVRRQLQDALERLGIDKVQAIIDAPNRASCQVVEKLGFSFLGQVTAYGSDEMVHYVLEKREKVANDAFADDLSKPIYCAAQS